MHQNPVASGSLVVLLAFLGLTLSGVPARAQTSPDFLFGKPKGTIGVRTGWVFASAKSDLFTDLQDQFTLDRKDFNAPAIGVDLDFAVSPRASVVIGFDFSKASKNSEYRDFVDNQRLPITQTTSLRETNLSGGIKFALTPRGREISSRAWIPASVTPYVGAGGGLMHYQLLQFGDFIEDDFDVVPDTIRSAGWTPSAHVFGGVDVKLSRRVYVSGEGRYLWSNATLGSDFIGFEPIDLAGFKLTGGVSYMF